MVVCEKFHNLFLTEKCLLCVEYEELKAYNIEKKIDRMNKKGRGRRWRKYRKKLKACKRSQKWMNAGRHCYSQRQIHNLYIKCLKHFLYHFWSTYSNFGKRRFVLFYSLPKVLITRVIMNIQLHHSFFPFFYLLIYFYDPSYSYTHLIQLYPFPHSPPLSAFNFIINLR